jgi:hypothetical protein
MQYYAWSDPVNALDSEGNEYVAEQITVMSEEDLVGYWRATHPKLAKEPYDKLLEDALCINWAVIVDYPRAHNTGAQ